MRDDDPEAMLCSGSRVAVRRQGDYVYTISIQDDYFPILRGIVFCLTVCYTRLSFCSLSYSIMGVVSLSAR